MKIKIRASELKPLFWCMRPYVQDVQQKQIYSPPVNGSVLVGPFNSSKYHE